MVSDCGSTRERLLAATLGEAGKHGYRGLAVRHIVESARVGRGTFYEHFADKADCFAQAHEEASEYFAARILLAAGGEPDWRSGVRAGLAELLDLVAADTESARGLLIEPEAAGEPMRTGCAKLTARFAVALDAARGEELPYRPKEAGTYVVGGVREVVASRLRSGETEQLADLLPGLVQFALLPYYGERAAAREKAAAVEWAARRRDAQAVLARPSRSGG